MENSIIETKYPIAFRKKEAIELGKLLNSRQSVELIGMPRVGISNFLRFFLYHKDLVRTYIHPTDHHIFIPVDLNDLVEREVFPLWVLTLKRMVDTAVISTTLPETIKKDLQELFLQSIQTKDLFLLIDYVRKSMMKFIEGGLYPTIFFIRFDRMKDAITPEFYANLQGLQDATNHKLAYVFTGFRELDYLSPHVFTKSSLSVFAKPMFVCPAKKEDATIIFGTYARQYNLSLSHHTEEMVVTLTNGYVQYLQLALIFLSEKQTEPKTFEELLSLLSHDERILFQSEELWENLEKGEQEILLHIVQGKLLTTVEKEKGKYLFKTGMVNGEKTMSLFSPLFSYFLEKKVGNSYIESSGGIEFSKKENLLFHYLHEHHNEICEREKIIEQVWAEVEAFGVSDWAIDRLVARVRSKLKLQKSPYEIQTVKTRGYKLV